MKQIGIFVPTLYVSKAYMTIAHCSVGLSDLGGHGGRHFLVIFARKKKDNLLSIYCLAGLTSCLTLAYEVVNNVFVQVVQIKIDKNVFFFSGLT